MGAAGTGEVLLSLLWNSAEGKGFGAVQAFHSAAAFHNFFFSPLFPPFFKNCGFFILFFSPGPSKL